MANELIEGTVAKMLERDGIGCEWIEEDHALLVVSLDAILARIQLRSRDMPTPTLTVLMKDFVNFPQDRRCEALHAVNVLNERCVGNLYVSEFGGVSYKMDYPVGDPSDAVDEFSRFAHVALSWFNALYRIFQKARWAGATIDYDMALHRRASQPDSDGEDGDDRIMTDKDIHDLMARGD